MLRLSLTLCLLLSTVSSVIQVVPDGATLECFQKSRESLEYISDILVEAGLSLSDLIILNPSIRPIEKMGRVAEPICISGIWRPNGAKSYLRAARRS